VAFLPTTLLIPSRPYFCSRLSPALLHHKNNLGFDFLQFSTRRLLHLSIRPIDHFIFIFEFRHHGTGGNSRAFRSGRLSWVYGFFRLRVRSLHLDLCLLRNRTTGPFLHTSMHAFVRGFLTADSTWDAFDLQVGHSRRAAVAALTNFRGCTKFSAFSRLLAAGHFDHAQYAQSNPAQPKS